MLPLFVVLKRASIVEDLLSTIWLVDSAGFTHFLYARHTFTIVNEQVHIFCVSN